MIFFVGLRVFESSWLHFGVVGHIHTDALDTDPRPAVAALLLVAVALTASYVPARRAAAVDPALTLQAE